MIDPSTPLLEAIVATVRTMNPSVKIYDEPPGDAKYPYVVVRIEVRDDGDGFCYFGSIATATLTICDDAPGTKRARQIGKQLTAGLGAELPVKGFDVVVHQCLGADYSPDSESDVRGVVPFQYDLNPVT